jgi:hypothetical protein
MIDIFAELFAAVHFLAIVRKSETAVEEKSSAS